jgi:hypothetical protein
VTRAFLITPFSGATAGNEDEDVFSAVQEAIARGARAAGVEVQRADDIFEAGVVVDQIRAAIESADLVIGVCTGKNPNVFYELGLAEVLGHKPILIASTSTDLPFDVQHWRAQLYEAGLQIEDLDQRLKRAIEDTLAARPAMQVVGADFDNDEAAISEKEKNVGDFAASDLVANGEMTRFNMSWKEVTRKVLERSRSLPSRTGRFNRRTKRLLPPMR